MDSSYINAKPTNVTYTHVKERGLMMKKYVEKDMGGCSLSGIMNEDGSRISSDDIVRSIAVLHERGNGLGGGFAAYGIYPEYREYYALHLMFNDERSKELTEEFVETNFLVELVERIPTRNVNSIIDPPILWRYFVRPKDKLPDAEEDDLVAQSVMKINSSIDGAFVMSSGKNMGVFKATGFPEDVAKFYKLEEYEAYTWIAHGRFPTNTPGWCGGAHPFSLLDWSVAHNGEISSYGTNKRYLEMFGYVCTLMTDTEVMTYLFDLLVRRHHLPIEIASLALASPLWYDIDRMPPERRELCKAIRAVYGSTLVNGPFAIILGYRQGMVGLNDRIKLRPLVAARKKNTLYLASEESGIREICKGPDEVWFPKAGEPVIGRLRVPVRC